MAYKKWVVGQDHTELVDENGKVVASLPRWSNVEKNAVGLAMLRTTPRHSSDSVSCADIQNYRSTESHVRRIGRTLALVWNR